jgi:hypothetical protein
MPLRIFAARVNHPVEGNAGIRKECYYLRQVLTAMASSKPATINFSIPESLVHWLVEFRSHEHRLRSYLGNPKGDLELDILCQGAGEGFVLPFSNNADVGLQAEVAREQKPFPNNWR